MKKVISRQLTSKGLLITFEDNTHCMLSPIQIDTLKSIGGVVPVIGNEVNVKPSRDTVGNLSTEWFTLIV